MHLCDVFTVRPLRRRPSVFEGRDLIVRVAYWSMADVDASLNCIFISQSETA